VSRVSVIVTTQAGTPYVIECADSAVADMVKRDVDAAEGWTVQETADIISVSAWWRLSGVALAGYSPPSSAPESVG
jgi:hypothetical protein